MEHMQSPNRAPKQALRTLSLDHDWVSRLLDLVFSIGISLIPIATGIGIFCLHKKGCLKLKVSKPQPDAEKGTVEEWPQAQSDA